MRAPVQVLTRRLPLPVLDSEQAGSLAAPCGRSRACSDVQLVAPASAPRI